MCCSTSTCITNPFTFNYSYDKREIKRIGERLARILQQWNDEHENDEHKESSALNS